MQTDNNVIIVGGGTAGIMTCAQLLRKNPKLSVAIIEPSDKHFYQPAWTLVGAGTFEYADTLREEKSLIPKGAVWIQDYVEAFEPEKNAVITRASGVFHYDYLIVAPGIQLDIDALPGLREALATDVVCSNYTDPLKTKEVLQNFKGGNALFTQPATPIKCGGAPQKIMYLAEEYFHKTGVRDKTNIIFATPGSVIFGVKAFADTLNEVVRKKDISVRFFYSPVRIDPENRQVFFRYIKPGENKCLLNTDKDIKEEFTDDAEIRIPYDMLHLAPPQSAPDFVKNSPLAHADGPSKGWLNVNIHTLQHNLFPNVFVLGDVAALPTAKTGAAIPKQAPVVVENILALLKAEQLSDNVYSGYSSCPLVTGYGKMVLAEFKYDNVRDSDPIISRFIDTSKEQYSMWLLKKYGLPYLYWNQMLKGKM
jgi:sulfide:quinone oxidoreductase